jgi:putative membrane protein
MNRTLPSEQKAKSFRKLIIALSIIIPVAVALLFGIKIDGLDFSFLPPIYATINGITAIVLISALLAIKAKNMRLHQRLMQFALILSLLFLVAYVLYHMTSDSTPYGGKFTYLYYTVLISHIVLSVIVIPIVLFAYLHAWKGDYETHKKWVRFAFPIWLYVAITGVVVYLMISPFYS